MPTESAPPPSQPPTSHPHPQAGPNKCAICGSGNGSSSSTSTPADDSVIILGDPIERICGRCVASPDGRRRMGTSPPRRDVGLGLVGVDVDVERSEDVGNEDRSESSRGPSPDFDRVMSLSNDTPSSSPLTTHDTQPQVLSQSLPSHHPRPWTTLKPSAEKPKAADAREDVFPTLPAAPLTSGKSSTPDAGGPPNPLLDITKARVPSVGRGALFPGSIFKGTQTSGRSAYEVEVQILDVNLSESTLCGYLSISHLTDSHPHLTTFFTGEIIGPKHGFITGSRFGATEHDDLRHWGRFEQFRRPSTRSDIVRSDLFFRDPLPDRSRGEHKSKERDFVFLRIKERFLVPDHKVRDISGASFAGFYYAMVDLSPTVSHIPESTPCTPLSPGPTTPSAYNFSGRQSYFDTNARSPRPEGTKRRESSSKMREAKETRGEATIRGYYFHSLNQEPFQELFLTHVPSRSDSTMEMR